MNALNLYGQIEQYLEFEDEVIALHQTFGDIIDQLYPTSLIDIGCGQGEFLKSLENTQIKTFGIDLSQTQIDICQKKELNTKCINLCDVGEKFDCATAIFDVINYLSKDDIMEFFRCSHTILNKNGYFIFDTNTLYGFKEVAQGSLNIDKKDKFISIDATYENEKLETKIILFEQDGNLYKKQSEAIIQYYHAKEFLNQMLEDCGFDVESVLDFKLHSEEQSDKQIFICRKI